MEMRERDKAIMLAAGPQMAIDHMRRETDAAQVEIEVLMAVAGDDPELLAACKAIHAGLETTLEGLDEWEKNLKTKEEEQDGTE